MRLFLIILLFFVGCGEKTQHKKVYIEDILPQKKLTKNSKEKKIQIKIKDLVFTKDSNSFKYSFDTKKILLFINDNKFSKYQLEELNKSKQKFYIVNNKKLIRFFKINKFPTIIITKDNNTTKTYEGYIPNEVLKYELKD